VFHLMIS